MGQCEWISVRLGCGKSDVLRGSVLGPVLFLAFVKDLPGAVCAMYANDTKVYDPVNNNEDRDTLQKDFDELVDWADSWQLCSMLTNVKYFIWEITMNNIPTN